MILVQRAELLQSLSTLVSSLPPNLAATMPKTDLQKVFRAMFDDFVWPQITARLPFEPKWDRLQRMYEVKRNVDSPRQRNSKENQTYNPGKETPSELSDTIIFDTVDRLKNLCHFISWKDKPLQYAKPRHIHTPLEDQFYAPTSQKVNSANALLDWNNEVQDVRQKALKLEQHHYLYGISFVFCDFVLEIDVDSSSEEYLLIKNIGTTFEPVSLRRLWLNPMLSMDEMDKQACPFFFDLQTRGTVLENRYDPISNPFGFANLEHLEAPQWLYGSESNAFTKALPEEARGIMTQMRPEFSGEALWTFYPYLKLPGTEKMERYIVQAYANNLSSGNIVPLRIQKLYYPKKRLPLFGACHIPDLDSGLYTPSIAEILESHFDELVRAKQDFLNNKEWINNPPTEIMTGSPALTVPEINRPGARYEVIGVNDVNRRQPFDATATNIAFIEMTRDSAQTSGKAVDAILGKAMGGRTTATEASNAFQASMSGVTTDVDHFGANIYRGYGQRHWENCEKFMPDFLRARICGNANAPRLDAQDLLIEIGIQTDVGSRFIESIAKQQHLQQAIASATASPVLDQATLWKALFRELKLPEALMAVRDNGVELEIARATEQAISTYHGQVIAIDPLQDHQIAMTVKTRFLQDTNSIYNRDMAGNPSPVQGQTVTQYLASQIQIHQQFVMLQMQQQMLMQQAALQDQAHAEQAKLNGPTHGAKPSNNPNPSPSQGAP